MPVETLIYYPNPILAKPAEPVEDLDEVHDLLDSLEDSLRYYGGLGLAAPQIGSSKRVFILDESKLLEIEDEQEWLLAQENPFREFINPEIIEQEGSAKFEEGCLSMPGIRLNVPRSVYVKIRAQDASGETFEYEATGYHAAAIQHEMDHLDGRMHFSRAGETSRRMALKRYKKIMTTYTRLRKMRSE